METYRKSIFVKLLGLQLPIIILLGFIGVNPMDSHAEEGDGANNAKSGASVVVRDPFWPVGYVPEKPQDKEDVARRKMLTGTNGNNGWNEAMKKVVINGVSSRGGNEYVAVINSKIKTVGESVSVEYGGSRYTWQVERIAPPGSVKLRRLVAE